jgi:hypothetical protein
MVALPASVGLINFTLLDLSTGMSHLSKYGDGQCFRVLVKGGHRIRYRTETPNTEHRKSKPKTELHSIRELNG